MSAEEGIVNEETSTTEENIIPEITFTQEPVSNQSSFQTEDVITNEDAIVDDTLEEEEILGEFEEEEYQHIVEDREYEENVYDDFEDEETILVEADDEMLFRVLKDKKGLSYESLDDLVAPKETKKYSPKLEKYQEFIEKTGNEDYNAFLETQKDWSAESEENILKSYLKLSNPDLNQKEVDRLWNRNYSLEDLDEEVDEEEILDRGIQIKTDLKKANEFFANRKKEFEAVGGSDAHIPEEYREAKKILDDQDKAEEEFIKTRDSRRNDFTSKTESLLNKDFKGFEIKYGNDADGFVDVVVKPENIEEVKNFQLELNNFNSQFFDKETGLLKDPVGYHQAMYMAQNYKQELHKARMTGRAEQLEINDKISKNIQPDGVRIAPTASAGGIVFSKEK